ncbi:TPA: phage tail protein, partial [Shigella flexneri]|nr:phage tail protein [Shigella flexneri]HBB9353337.1 phage tail protein [Shigella flexneri]
MAKNDFKAFATDRNANVMSQEEWEALPALISGFTAGKASSAQVNKVIRQASFIAAALAQFVSDKTQRDVLDNGDLPGFVELLGSGFAVEYLSRKNPFGDIKSDGTVKTALENLGLGEAAKRNVGTGANQIPDMSLFASSNTATAAAQKFPSGLILQCGQLNGSPNVSSTYGMRFPMTFSRVLAVTVTLNVTGASGQPTVSATNVHNTGF